MKMISRRDFMKASAVVGAAGVLTACGGSSSSTAASSVAASTAASSAAASTTGSANIGVCIYQFADNFMTLYRTDLEEYLKDMGYAVGLHTGGAYPRVLERVLPMLDWVGMDVKADPRDAAHFDRTAGAKGAAEHFLLSHRLLKESGVAHELRTTAHPDWLPDERLLSLAEWLKSEKVVTFALQIYRRPPGGLLTGLFPAVGIDYPAPETTAALKAAVAHFVERRNDR